ncbi:MAG TPA: DUF6152 family protein [Steroidobacteraceae bacterium]|nr:DUF6152 family protein [Steroidobacteraceae bacterium]
MKSIFLATLLAAGALGLSSGASAHHSSAMYDLENKVLIEGTVSQFQWVNPHSWLWLKVPDGNGGMDDYALECGSIAQLMQIGWTREKVKVGDKVKVVGALRKDGVKRGEVFTLITADGETLKNRVGY